MRTNLEHLRYLFMFYFHIKNNARRRQIATNSTWEVKSCFRLMMLKDLPFILVVLDLGGNAFEICPFDIWFWSPITISWATTVLGLSTEINVTLSTEVKRAAQHARWRQIATNSTWEVKSCFRLLMLEVLSF